MHLFVDEECCHIFLELLWFFAWNFQINVGIRMKKLGVIHPWYVYARLYGIDDVMQNLWKVWYQITREHSLQHKIKITSKVCLQEMLRAGPLLSFPNYVSLFHLSSRRKFANTSCCCVLQCGILDIYGFLCLNVFSCL